MAESALKRFLTDLKQDGLARTAHRAWFRIRRVHKFFVYRMDLAERVPDFPPPLGYSLREVPLGDLPKIREGRENLPSEFYRDQVTRENRCFGAFLGEDPAFFTWISAEGIQPEFVPLRPGDVEQDFSYCRETHRGKKLLNVTTTFVAKQLQREGKNALWTHVHEDNVASIKGVLQAGFKQVGVVKRWIAFTWKDEGSWTL